MFLQWKKHPPSSKLARCWRGSCYGLGFAASAVFLIVMIWILWFYLGVTKLPLAEPQRRAIVHYGTTTTKYSEATPSNPITVLLEKSTTSSPSYGSSRDQVQPRSDSRRDESLARNDDQSSKRDFAPREKVLEDSRSNESFVRSADNDKSRSTIISNDGERSVSRETSEDDRKRSRNSDESVSVRIVTSLNPETRSFTQDGRPKDDRAIEPDRRSDTIDREPPRRSSSREDRGSPRNDDPYYDRDLPSSRRSTGNDRPISGASERLPDDARYNDREYARSDSSKERDYSRPRYEDDERDNDRRSKGDGGDFQGRDHISPSRRRTDYDRDTEYRDKRYREGRYRDRIPIEDRDSSDRYRPRYDDDRYIRRDDGTRDDRYRSSVDDRRDDRYRSSSDDRRDDRYKSADDDYRKDDRYRDRNADERYGDDDRYRNDDKYRDGERYRDDDRYRDGGRYRDDRVDRDRSYIDDEYRRKEDRYRDPVEDRYRSRTDLDSSRRPVGETRPNTDDRYRSESSPDSSALRRTDALGTARRDILDEPDRRRPNYRDDIPVTPTRSKVDPLDYRSRDRDRSRDDDYISRESISSSRREGGDRTRVRSDPKYDDFDEKTSYDRYDDKIDRYPSGSSSSSSRRSNEKGEYQEYRPSIAKDENPNLKGERSIYAEDKTIPRNLRDKLDDGTVDRRSYSTDDDRYSGNRPRADSKYPDDDYRPSRRRFDDDRDYRDDRYDERRRDKYDYEDRNRDKPKGEYVRDRDRDTRRREDDDRDYRRPNPDRYLSDRDTRIRENITEDRIRDRNFETSRSADTVRNIRPSMVREPSESVSRYYDDEDYRQPSRRPANRDISRPRDTYERENPERPRMISSRDESQFTDRERRYEVTTRPPCSKRRNSFSDEPGLSFRRVDDYDDCDESGRYSSSSTMSYTRDYDNRRKSSPRALSPKEIIEEAYRHSESDNLPKEAIYPVYDPRISNITSPEVIRPNERRGTIITAGRRKRRSLLRRKK